MASVSGNYAVHASLSTTTVDTITITTDAGYLDIYNRTGTADMFVSVDPSDPTATPTNPTAAGAGFYAVSQNGDRRTRIPLAGGGRSSTRAVVVKIIGNGNAYSVQGGY